MATVTSLLTLAETLVMPYRLKNKGLISAYRNLFKTPHPNLVVLPPKADILDKAAQLRAAIPTLFLPDAIYLATAQVGECDQLLTNDERLKAAATPTVVLLRD